MKVIKSPIERWAGTVTIADPLTIPQAQLIEAGLKQPEGHEGEARIWLTVIDSQKLPAVFACVEKWELENFPDNPTLETYPASPRADSHKLAEWIFNELLTVYFGESIVPKA